MLETKHVQPIVISVLSKMWENFTGRLPRQLAYLSTSRIKLLSKLSLRIMFTNASSMQPLLCYVNKASFPVGIKKKKNQRPRDFTPWQQNYAKCFQTTAFGPVAACIDLADYTLLAFLPISRLHIILVYWQKIVRRKAAIYPWEWERWQIRFWIVKKLPVKN